MPARAEGGSLPDKSPAKNACGIPSIMTRQRLEDGFEVLTDQTVLSYRVEGLPTASAWRSWTLEPTPGRSADLSQALAVARRPRTQTSSRPRSARRWLACQDGSAPARTLASAPSLPCTCASAQTFSSRTAKYRSERRPAKARVSRGGASSCATR